MLKFLRKNENLICIILLLVIAGITHAGWLFTTNIYSSGDWQYVSNEKYQDFVNMSPIWVVDNLGTTSATPHFYLIRFFEGILNIFGSNFAINEKIFFFIPMILGSSIGSFIFLRRYFKPRFAFVGSLVFMFNTPFLFNHAGPLTIGVVFALTPLLLHYFIKFYYNPQLKNGIILGILTSISIYYELRCTLLVGFIMASYLLYKLITTKRSFKLILKQFILFIPVGLLILLLNLFWIIPYIFSSKDITFSDRLTQGLFTTFSSLSNALTLTHPFWTGSRPSKFIVQDIPLYSWIIPILAFGGIFITKKIKKNKDIVFWSLIALLGIILVKQVNEPFIDLYPWIFENIPGFAAFRESSKFYVFIAVGYAVLIPFTVKTLLKIINKNRVKVLISIVIYIIPILIFLFNSVPLLKGDFRTMYIERNIPEDYSKLSKFINDQNQYFRTLWFPTSSRWSIQTSKNPILNAVALNKGEWLNQLSNNGDTNETLRDKSTNLLKNFTSDDALDSLSIKYVIIPLRDYENEDDFFKDYGNDRQYYINILDNIPYLKKLDIDLKDIIVYENDSYSNYITAFADLTSINLQEDNVNDIKELYKNLQIDEFKFTDKVIPELYKTQEIKDVFGSINTSFIKPDIEFKNLINSTLYIDTSKTNLFYEIVDSVIRIYYIDGDNIEANNLLLQSNKEELLGNFKVDKKKQYYFLIDNQLVEIPIKNGLKNFGIVDLSTLRFFEKKDIDLSKYNLSFEKGLWNDSIQNCSDDIAPKGMNIELEKEPRNTKGSNHIKLTTLSGIPCTISPNIILNSPDYLLSFDFKTINTDNIGYDLVFNNSKKSFVINESSNNWATYKTHISIPAEEKNLKIQLEGFNNYQLKGFAQTYYDHISLSELSEIYLKIPSTKFQETIIDSSKLNLEIKNLSEYPNKNIFTNGSFNEGLWEKTVSDCNNFDDKPLINMSVINEENRQNILQLEAQRHASCTSKKEITVKEGKRYLLKFEYQSPNATFAKYNISFNDDSRTRKEELLEIKDKKWNSFVTSIKVPYGANKMNITVYSYGEESGRNNIINKYDNFELIEVPDLIDKYFLINNKNTSINAPKTTYVSLGNTKKIVTVENAKEPFYLSLSETYNSQWKIRGKDQSGFIDEINPLKNNISNSDKYHFTLNSIQNGWFIDPEEFCRSNSCSKNSDGTYTIDLIIEFIPQRWFYIGSLIGIVTFVLSTYYVTYFIIIKRNDKEKHQLHTEI